MGQDYVSGKYIITFEGKGNFHVQLRQR